MSKRSGLATIFSSRGLATISIAGCLASFRAGAALETVTESVSYPQTQTDFSTSLELPQFNPASGQLESVVITATGNGSFTQFYQNLSTSSGNVFTIWQNLDLILSLPVSGPASLLDVSLSSGTHTYSTQPYVSGSPFFTAPSGGTSLPYVASGSSTPVTLSDSASLGEFTGSGSINFLLTANGSSTNNETSGNYFVGGSSSAGLTLTVAYNFLAVPEPATWAWIGGVFAMGGLCLYRSRRPA